MQAEMLETATGILLLLILGIVSVYDIRFRRIPNAACAAILMLALFAVQPVRYWGILTVVPLLIAASVSDGMGGGDVKLTGVCGMLLGWEKGGTVLTLSFVLLLLFHACRWAAGRILHKKPGRRYPFAPFYTIGTAAVYAAELYLNICRIS